MWEESYVFKVDFDCLGEFYCVVILFFNVIGSLYMGYVFESFLIDILVCYYCMWGDNIFWLLGMDYVSIVV